ncbi:MAG: lactoylglutathione lyase [Flavobacteriales bacterium]|nr:MAG: lactoylglutathione lyase [Flavobacteriales bacterium]
MQAEFILYVADQARSRDFYRTVLATEPTLDVPGMTEFDLGGCKLGLMPEAGIARIITPALPHPSRSQGVPRCELYLLVANAEEFIGRFQAADAIEVSSLLARDWGHRVAYFADPDGHVLAIAEPIAQP